MSIAQGAQPTCFADGSPIRFHPPLMAIYSAAREIVRLHDNGHPFYPDAPAECFRAPLDRLATYAAQLSREERYDLFRGAPLSIMLMRVIIGRTNSFLRKYGLTELQ